MSDPLGFTGERFTPECQREIWYEHYHRYVFASGLVEGRRVLDAACGEGYGSALLAGSARSVTGVDISPDAIAHAIKRYQDSKLSFQQADCCSLPFPDGSFDCVVSFETIEHLEDQSGLLREFGRVLGPEGFLVISSPDKAVYTDRCQADNEFHVKELYAEELDALLAEQFPARRMLGQKLLFHSAIWALPTVQGNESVTLHQSAGGQVSRLQAPGHDAMYLIALCAASVDRLPVLDGGLWLFDDQQESVYEHYHHEIRKNMAAGRILAERERELDELKAGEMKAGAEPLRPWWRRWFTGG